MTDSNASNVGWQYVPTEIGNIQNGAELGMVWFPEIILSEALFSGNDPGQNDMFFQKLGRGVIWIREIISKLLGEWDWFPEIRQPKDGLGGKIDL